MIYDAAILGAGPAGSVAALLLAATGHSVVLIDPLSKARKKIGESLSGAAKPLLAELELMDIVEKCGHITSFGNASAWMHDRLEQMDAMEQLYGSGWHLDRRLFDEALRQEACSAGAFYSPQRLLAIESGPESWNLGLANSDVACRWLIDASGRAGVAARKLAIERISDDALRAVYAWVDCSSDDEDTLTLVEASSYGWWYTARLPDGTRVVSLHSDSDFAKSIRQDPSLWRTLLLDTVHIKNKIATLPDEGSLRFADASSSRLAQFCGPRWIACGDAAMSFDPLSSQGIFNALVTGRIAALTVMNELLGKAAVAAYAQNLERIWEQFITQQRLYYGVVSRWKDQPFWMRRSLEAHANRGE